MNNIISLTPDLARIVIQNGIIYTSITRGTFNNWPDDKKLSDFIYLMREGKWLLKDCLLYVNPNGGVQDAHHRILSVFLSGTTQRFEFKIEFNHVSLNNHYQAKYPALWQAVSENIDKGIFINVKKHLQVIVK